MSMLLPTRRRSPLPWLALVALLAACTGGELDLPQPAPDAGTTPPAERGFTDCGNDTSFPVKCQPGQYCQSPVFRRCESGCLSDTNCANNQICDKATSAQVGVCQNTTAPACSASQPCPSGQTCVNGTCRTTTTPACGASQPCPSGQTCVNGTCTTPPPSTQCTPRPDGLDGCPSLSLCEDTDGPGPQAPACQTFPACDATRSCPPGLTGAVCNDNYIPNKGLFCIPYACRDASNCPSNWACVRYPSTQVLGACSDRSFGMFCTQNSECLSSKCNNGGTPGNQGTCG